MKKALTILLTLITITTFAQTGGGIIYGPNHSYMLTAPDGWVLDNRAGVKQGLHAVFYPKGENWLDAPIVMYSNFVTLDDNQSLKWHIKGDIKAFKKNSNGKAEFVKDIKTEAGEKFKVYSYSYTADGGTSREYVAFCRAKTGVVTIVCHTQASEKQLQATEPKFVELVESYKWLGSDVKIEE